MAQSMKKVVEKLIAEIGGELDISDYRVLSIGVWTPKGKIWKSTLCHCIYSSDYYSEKHKAWKELYDQMIVGIEDCNDSDCEYCK